MLTLILLDRVYCKHMIKRKEICRSGSDSGVSCDGTKSPVNSEKNVELLAALEKKMKAIHYGEENSTMEESRELEHGKLVSNDDCNNILRKKICSTTKASINTVNPSTFDTSKINSGSPVKPSSRTSQRHAKPPTVFTKCFVKNTDDWNKYLLGKSKINPTSVKSSDKSIKVTSETKEEISTIKEDKHLESTKVADKNKITPEKKILRSGVEVKSEEKHTNILKISAREKKTKNAPIKTGDSSQKKSLDQTIKISDVNCAGPRKDDGKISKIDNETMPNTTLEVLQGTIEPCIEISNNVEHLIHEVNSGDKCSSPRKKRSRTSLECNDKSTNNNENQVSKRKRQISETSKTETHNVEHNQEAVQRNIKSPLRTRTSTLENKNTELTIEEIKSPVREVKSVGTSIKTRSKQKLSFSETTSNDKINIFEPKSNLSSLVISDVKDTINSPEIQSQQSNQTSSESQINENLELRSPKSKRSRRIIKQQSPQKTPNKNKKNLINSTDTDHTNNSLEILINNDKNNCKTDLQIKYEEILNCNLNPIVSIERLRQFSGNQWISKNLNIKNISIKSDPDVNLNTQCGAMDLTGIKTESPSPRADSEPFILRDVRIVLEDIGRGEKHRKIIKLDRNWNLTRVGNRSNRFQYKYKTDLTAVTSRNDLFQQTQLTKGFSFKSPLNTPLVLQQIPMNENHITMLHSPEEHVQFKDIASNLSEENIEINEELNDTSHSTESIHKLDETDQVKHVPKMISVESVNVFKLPENTSSETITESDNLLKENESCPTETVENISSKTKKPKHNETNTKMLKSKIRVKLPEKLFKNYEKRIEKKCKNVEEKKDKIDIQHDKNKINKLPSKYSLPVKIPIEIYNEYKKRVEIEKQKNSKNSNENINKVETNKDSTNSTETIKTVDGNKDCKNSTEKVNTVEGNKDSSTEKINTIEGNKISANSTEKINTVEGKKDSKASIAKINTVDGNKDSTISTEKIYTLDGNKDSKTSTEKINTIEENKDSTNNTEKINTVEGNKTNVSENGSVKLDNSDKSSLPEKTNENIINTPTETNNSENTNTRSSVLETVINVLSTNNQIKLNEKLLSKSIDIKEKRKPIQNNMQHKIIHDNTEEITSLHADNTSKKIILRSKRGISTENIANILTSIKPQLVDENLELSRPVEAPNLNNTGEDISQKKDQLTEDCTSDNDSNKSISDSQFIQTEQIIEDIEQESEVSENIEMSPIDQISSDSTIDPAVIITHLKPKKIFRTKEKNSNILENTGIISPENRLSTDTNVTSCSNVTQKPKHIFKFSGTPTIKRPPTRQSGKVKLKRPILSPEVFKVPAVFSPISQSVKSSPQSPPKKKSPRKGNPNLINKVFPKKTEIEVDTISIYAETIGADSITDISVTNDSSDESDENFGDIFNILPEPSKHTDVDEWVDNTVKICEIEKEKPPLLGKTVLPAEDIVPNNLGSEQEAKETSLTNISIESSIDRETDTYSVVGHFDKHTTTKLYNNSAQLLKSSNITRAIDIFKSVCSHFIKNGECTKISCIYRHEYPPNWNEKIDTLPTESLLELYDFAKENKAVHLYKHIFFTITEHIGNKRDFNTLIRMVKDVIEMDINSDRSPYISIIIDTLCKTGVTFNSIVEFVYKNANVGPEYINLLSDILINLIVDRADCDGNWITIRELLKNINYALDNGIFRAIIVECLQKESPKKELFLKVYYDLIKHIADDKLVHLNESILNNFYNRLLKFKLKNEADEYYDRCQSLNITLGNKSDHSSSPASSVANSSASKTITKVSPFQTVSKIDSKDKIVPVTPPTKPQLPSITHSTPNSPAMKFDLPTFIPNHSTSSFSYSGTTTVPQKFSTPPPLIPFNHVPSLISNITPSYELPGPSFVDDNFVSPPPPMYNRPVVLRQASQERNRLLSDSGFRNNKFTSHSRTHSPMDPVSPVSPTFSSQIYYEVQGAIQRENISLLFSLIMKYKDNDLTDVFIKTAVDILVQHNPNYPKFYNNLCQTAILLSSMEDPTLAYVLKTLGLNLLLSLTDQSDWDPAFIIYNTLKNHFNDLNDILNVKLYLKEKYSYFKRILIIIELHIKKFKFQSAWNMLKEHIFQCNIWQGENNDLEIMYRNKIVDELLSCIVEKKLWRLGLNIVQYVMKNNISEIEVKKHTNEIFLQAINNKCEINVFVEFEKCSPSWYNYISDIIYRSILTHAVSKYEFALAKRYYEIGRHFDVYPDVCGNESYLQFKMSFVFEEILLIFQIFFEKMIRFYPVQHNITLRIMEGTQLHSNEHVPINLQQYNITSTIMLTRLANILNNHMTPPITIINQNNSLLINADTINKHLDARRQRNTFDQLLRK